MNRPARSHDLFIVLMLLALAELTAGCAASGPVAASIHTQRFEYSQVHMGVRARIVLYGESESMAAEAARAAFDRIAQLDAMMSDYRSDSELMRLSDRAGTGPVGVSDELFEVLAFARDLHERSGGAFDVTAGPIVSLWREMRRTGSLASPQVIAAARDLVGSQWMRFDNNAQTVELIKHGMRLDLGGIAKGYACDAAAEVLRAHGIDRFLVAMAGDIVVGDAPPGTSAWEIAAERGASDAAGQAATTVRLVNAAISTSGDAEQFVKIEGVRYSHIVDPRTGLGSPRRLAATVVAPRGMLADAIATALCLMPAEEGLQLAQSFPGVGAMVEEVRPEAQAPILDSSGRMKSVP